MRQLESTDPSLHKPTRVARRKEKTRLKLMEAALALFNEKGIYWATIEDITEKSDVGKGTFYQHFETKESLLYAILEEGLDKLLDETAHSVKGITPGRQVVSLMIQAQLNFFLDRSEYLLLYHQTHGLLRLKVQEMTSLRDLYTAYFEKLGRILLPSLGGRGEKRSEKAREIGMTLSAFTTGMLSQQLLFGSPREPKSRAELQTLLERSILALI